MKKVIIALSILIGCILIGSGTYVYALYHSMKETASQMYQPVGSNGASNSENTGRSKPLSILLLGVDERPNDPGRSDTMIVMTINPKNQKLQMISIPRDTRAEIVGKGKVDKINSAYAYGGPKMAMDTVNQFLNIHLDHYIKINMQGLKDLVDSVGGITVYNDISWHDEGIYKKGYYYHKGKLHLNGAQALGYARMRHLDPRGDFGRNERQRQVIMAVINKAASAPFTKYNDILKAIGHNVQTDLTFDQMKDIALHGQKARKNVVSYEMKGDNAYINGIYYLLVSQSERNKVAQMIESGL
ncbi:LCP family protein required for cell wall assembly [Scopulibacillus daqui]|uniref:LCP family protein required for cell wall assembly n=1 Tax=Scopulibacillus daqui TaxID=1469162 RepID=A0ABS2Q4K8_9BACL|nr:LCP family protein required for cell wall assembly [Scopulibacillus daqui]